MILKSKTTGVLVLVTGPGKEPGTFAGQVTGKPPQFCYSWDCWESSNFEPAEANSDGR